MNIPDEPSSPATVSQNPDDASISQASLSKVGDLNLSIMGNRHDLTVSKRKIRIMQADNRLNIDKFNNILASTKSPVGGTFANDLQASQQSYGENSMPSARRIIINTPKETIRQKIESNDRPEM